jgi:hypothetical protein
MSTTGVRDYCLTTIKKSMKNKISILYLAITVIFLFASCNNRPSTSIGSPEITETDNPEGLIPVGKDIITEIIVKPDTLGDPWETEKVKGFDGNLMLTDIFRNIYSGKLTVYDCITGDELKKNDVRKLEEEFNSDLSRIAKLQFLEDWYFNPVTNEFDKKIKSISFGYEIDREAGLPRGYKALFQVNTTPNPEIK